MLPWAKIVLLSRSYSDEEVVVVKNARKQGVVNKQGDIIISVDNTHLILDCASLGILFQKLFQSANFH